FSQNYRLRGIAPASQRENNGHPQVHPLKSLFISPFRSAFLEWQPPQEPASDQGWQRASGIHSNGRSAKCGPVSVQSYSFEVQPETGQVRVAVEYTYPDPLAFGQEGGIGPLPAKASFPS